MVIILIRTIIKQITVSMNETVDNKDVAMQDKFSV